MISPILHKKQFNYVTSNSIPVEGSQAYSTLAQSNIPITKSGYLYVFVSNESSNVAVYFDNLNITHTKGALLEETHYYAYGLEIKGISSRAQGLAVNKFKYNKGTELEDALDLNLYETPLRRLDAQLGRFTGVDIMASETYYLNPYHYATNNPISFNDPTGALSSAADMASARLQTGPDGRDHVGWMCEIMWGSPEFFMDNGGEVASGGGESNKEIEETYLQQSRELTAIAMGELEHGQFNSLDQLVLVASIYINRFRDGKAIGNGSSWYSKRNNNGEEGKAYRFYMFILGDPKFSNKKPPESILGNPYWKSLGEKASLVFETIKEAMKPNSTYTNKVLANRDIQSQGYNGDLNLSLNKQMPQNGFPKGSREHTWNRYRWFVYAISYNNHYNDKKLVTLFNTSPRPYSPTVTFLFSDKDVQNFFKTRQNTIEWFDTHQAPLYNVNTTKFNRDEY